MNFVATIPRQPKACRDEVASGATARSAAAGDTYLATLVKLLEIGEQLKIQSIAIEHARERATKRDWAGVQIGLAVLCDAAKGVRKLAAETNARIDPDFDDACNVYGG